MDLTSTWHKCSSKNKIKQNKMNRKSFETKRNTGRWEKWSHRWFYFFWFWNLSTFELCYGKSKEINVLVVNKCIIEHKAFLNLIQRVSMVKCARLTNTSNLKAIQISREQPFSISLINWLIWFDFVDGLTCWFNMLVLMPFFHQSRLQTPNPSQNFNKLMKYDNLLS